MQTILKALNTVMKVQIYTKLFMCELQTAVERTGRLRIHVWVHPSCLDTFTFAFQKLYRVPY